MKMVKLTREDAEKFYGSTRNARFGSLTEFADIRPHCSHGA
ncbi:MAG: hypothetical protein R2875_03385 [Desulfobacterales bacterium]